MLELPSILKPLGGGYAPAIRSLSGGQSLAGFEQVASQMNDRWRASFSFKVNSSATLMALRAFVIQMRGRQGTVLLPVFDRSRAPWAIDQAGRQKSPALMRTRSLDGTSFADPPDFNDGLMTATVATDALLNDTNLTVAVAVGSVPEVGHYFSIGSRLYMVEAVNGAGPYTVGIWPWLREDVAAGEPINFTSPACEMRFESDDEGTAALLGADQMKFANVTLSFVEAPPVPYAREMREDGGYELRE
jgi:hypothetical protein